MIDLDEIADTLELLPTALRTLLAPYDDPTLRARPAAGEWCVLEVVGHLLTCDRGAFRDRVTAIISGVAEIPRFDAHAALAERDPMGASLDDLLDELASVRAESVEFVRSLTPEALTATAPYGEHGLLAAGDFVLEWPFHDQDHIRQILDAVQRHYLPHMTESMRTALTEP